MFHELWKAGDTAHLNLNTHAGQAWVGIRTPLGHPGQPQQYQHQTPNYYQYSHPSPNHRSPSYFRRKQRRQAAKAAEETTTNQEEKTAEEADHAEKYLNNLTNETIAIFRTLIQTIILYIYYKNNYYHHPCTVKSISGIKSSSVIVKSLT